MKEYTLWYYVWGYKPRFLQGLRFWWKHRHETPADREVRFAATRKHFSEMWSAYKEEMSGYPESRGMLEFREMMDEIFLDKKE